MSFIGKNGFFGALKPADPHYARYALDPSYAKFVDKYSRGGGSENGLGTLGRAFAYQRPKLAQGGSISETDNPYDGEGVPENNAGGGGHVAARGGADYSWGPGDWDNDGAEIMPTGHDNTKRRKLARGGATERRHAYFTVPLSAKESVQKIHVDPEDHEGLVTINILQEMPTSARLVHGRIISPAMAAHGPAADKTIPSDQGLMPSPLGKGRSCGFGSQALPFQC
jgi:hypothetical protein